MPPVARLRNVQCLRAIAALLVIDVHEPDYEQHFFGWSFLSWLRVPGGTGVDLFFVISGFIMVTTSWNAFGREGASRAFLIRRIERIYPMYWILSGAYLASHVILTHGLSASFATTSDIVASFLLAPHGKAPVLSVGWTLEYEMAFYLVFAAMLFFARRRLGTMLAAWLALVLAANVIDVHVPNGILDFIGSPLHCEFLIGAVVGIAVASGRIVAPFATLALGAAGVAAVFAYTTSLPALPSLWFRALVVAPPMALVLYGAVGLETLLGTRMSEWLARLGDASYSLYLSHMMVLSLVAVVAARLPLHGAFAQTAFVIGSYASCVGVAFVLYRFVEKPLLVALHSLSAAATAVPRTAVAAAEMSLTK